MMLYVNLPHVTCCNVSYCSRAQYWVTQYLSHSVYTSRGEYHTIANRSGAAVEVNMNESESD